MRWEVGDIFKTFHSVVAVTHDHNGRRFYVSLNVGRYRGPEATINGLRLPVVRAERIKNGV